MGEGQVFGCIYSVVPRCWLAYLSRIIPENSPSIVLESFIEILGCSSVAGEQQLLGYLTYLIRACDVGIYTSMRVVHLCVCIWLASRILFFFVINTTKQ